MKIENDGAAASGTSPAPPPDHGPGQAVSEAKLIEWVAGAQRGARLIYATGVHCRASCGERVADLVEALGANGKGFVSAHFQKVASEDGGRAGRYLVQRTERKAHPGELAALAAETFRKGRR